MSDSLRDQLLKAGFSAPEPKPERKPKKKSGKARTSRPHAPGSQQGSKQADSNKPVQTEPRAGYTHVKPVAPKKKKNKAPAVKPRAGSWSTRAHTEPPVLRAPADPQAAAKRREMRDKIQKLIDASALENFKGEEVYRFTLQNKIRELMVSEPIRKQLVAGELAITRLNGATRLIPAASASQVRDINPQWVIFLTTDAGDSSDDDDEFPVPDDLVW